MMMVYDDDDQWWWSMIGGINSSIDLYEGNDLLIQMLDWRPVEEAVMKYNLDHDIPINDTDFFLSM